MADFMIQMKIADLVEDPWGRPAVKLSPEDEREYRDLYQSVSQMLFAFYGVRLIPRDPTLPLPDDYELPDNAVTMRAGDLDALRRLAVGLDLPLHNYV